MAAFEAIIHYLARDTSVHCGNYRIIYRMLDEETVEIITLVHGSQQYDPQKRPG